ncbi:MAG TPA: phosphatidylglycerol lysyltransferase domain-containing protein [Patescibacteria group bacterium]|nr:phosphatidylglycerol lysyltransferase domain-containing protein [Patescibacteria group bacterium]
MITLDQSSKLDRLTLRVLVFAVAVHGIVLIASTLNDQLLSHVGIHTLRMSGFVFGLPILFGLTLLYLSSLLRRRKHTAWVITLVLYALIWIFGLVQLSFLREPHPLYVGTILRNVLLPLLIFLSLFAFRREFVVKSDIQSFKTAARFSVFILLVAFIYGVGGFLLMDHRDFHQEITFGEAVHRTVDQFDLTTSGALHPFTRRAKIFVDSLSVISVGAIAYVVISLFQPLKAKFTDQTYLRESAETLLKRHNGSSEDIFKLWPHDKIYYFNAQHSAGLAYAVSRGIALVVGDPFGDKAAFPSLLRDFDDVCRPNDWLPAYIHTEPEYAELYKQAGMTLQKIGEEAVLDIEQYDQNVKNSKYFRHIRNKFEKQGYKSEVLMPPHSTTELEQLQAISTNWLSQPGREERRFMMGNYSTAYMQECPVLVLRDESGAIKAFINQVKSFDPEEANFDLLRQTGDALGNSNDYVLMQFIEYAKASGFKRVNLGLCPLSGLSGRDEERSVIDSALSFLYANGDRFYSFSGLHRFKTKYQPQWSGRYIAYRGGIRGFTRVLNALNRAMKV